MLMKVKLDKGMLEELKVLNEIKVLKVFLESFCVENSCLVVGVCERERES